jgi:tetratricopeptide (TPR) repeat protein
LPLIAVLMALLMPAAGALQGSQSLDGLTVQGSVHDSDGKPVGDALVRLERKDVPGAVETKTNAEGEFRFSTVRSGSYVVSAEKSGVRSKPSVVITQAQGQQKIDLMLEDSRLAQSNPNNLASSAIGPMTFADKPNFTVAGVTDWTAVGGHGSDSSLRTSESLASETLALKSGHDAAHIADDVGGSESKLRANLARGADGFEANHALGDFYLHAGRYKESIPLLQKASQIDPQNFGNEYDLALAYEGDGDLSLARDRVRELLGHQENADLHRLAGEIDERLGDPLTAVHEYERAVRLDPTEQNYFEWGSELLLHRAVWQAQEVFRKGAEAYPKSARMLTGLGAALFAGAVYDEAAVRLCAASDLNPADREPYIFMGKMQMAAPNPMACVEQKLARFVQEQPGDSLANYFYAMALLKRQQQSPDKLTLQRVEELLTQAVTVDTKCSDAYLQLGILSASERNFEKAIDFYTKAIAANPQMGEAHYRLGVAYDRIGESAKAKREFQLHDEIKKKEAEDVERQRREVKQFLVVLPGQPTPTPVP